MYDLRRVLQEPAEEMHGRHPIAKRRRSAIPAVTEARSWPSYRLLSPASEPLSLRRASYNPLPTPTRAPESGALMGLELAYGKLRYLAAAQPSLELSYAGTGRNSVEVVPAASSLILQPTDDHPLQEIPCPNLEPGISTCTMQVECAISDRGHDSAGYGHIALPTDENLRPVFIWKLWMAFGPKTSVIVIKVACVHASVDITRRICRRPRRHCASIP